MFSRPYFCPWPQEVHTDGGECAGEMVPRETSTAAVVVVVESLSHVRLFVTPWTAACQTSLSFTVSQSLLKLMSVESMMSSHHLILCCAFLFLPSIFPGIRVFSNESTPCIWWPKYWRLSFSISPSNEYSGLISFRINWFDLLAVPGTLKSLLQHHSLKASILWCSAFLMAVLIIIEIANNLNVENNYLISKYENNS